MLFSSGGLSKRATKEANFYTIIRLWIHESCRVFSDRFNDSADRIAFYQSIRGIIESEFKVRFDYVFAAKESDIKISPRNALSLDETMKNLYFGITLNLDKKLYREMVDLEQVKNTIGVYLVDFNKISRTPMDLVIFDFFIEHVVRVGRMLKLQTGNGLLIGKLC